MISQREVVTILREYLPEIAIVFSNKRVYIGKALQHPYIQQQIKIGLYDAESIYDDFLSAAVSYPTLNQLEVCYELIVDHAEGVDDDLTRAYIRNMARHEAHHFETRATPEGWREHAENEQACIQAITEQYPALEKELAEFEKQSPVFQRVYKRMGAIHV